MSQQAQDFRTLLENEKRDLQQQYSLLVESDGQLEGTQQARERSSDPAGGDGDQTSVERGGIKTMLRGLEKRLGEIDRALDALEDGSYGTCEQCGNAIPAERLEALPGVARCVACA